MNPKCEQFIGALLNSPAELVIIGKGSQAQHMRKFIIEALRLKNDHLIAYSSFDAPLGGELYVLCATPQLEAFKTLVNRGVEEKSILLWSELKSALIEAAEEVTRVNIRLEPIKALAYVPIDALLSATESAFKLRLNISQDWDEPFLADLEMISKVYLELRKYRASQNKFRPSRFLFPSPGRCGGNSIAKYYRSQPRYYFRVSHENYADIIYRMLSYHLRGRISDKPLVAVLSVMLNEFDCLGGNPLCFLMPFLSEIPWYDYYMLKVSRTLKDHCDSIINRNFHYTSYDYVQERTTAVEWNDMDENEWLNLSLEEKVIWYIQKVDAEIERGFSSCIAVIKTPLNELNDGLQKICGLLGWPIINDVPHVNTIPKDRIYSMEERIALYKEESQKIKINSPAESK